MRFEIGQSVVCRNYRSCWGGDVGPVIGHKRGSREWYQVQMYLGPVWFDSGELEPEPVQADIPRISHASEV